MHHISNRIAVLDGLRALAILLVLLRHSIKPFWSDLSDPYIPLGPIDLGAIFINGWMGVDLFFVLSGFLISSHLLQGLGKGRPLGPVLRSYIPRRFFRIAPVYYFVLALAVFGLFPFYPYPQSYENIVWRVLYHLIFMQDYWPSDIVVVFWSLAIEIKFYVLAPFLIYGLLKLKNIAAQAALLVALVISQPLLRAGFAPDAQGFEAYFETVRTSFHFCLDGLLLGMLAALLWNHERLRAILSRPVPASALFFGGALLVLGLAASGPLVDLEVSGFDKSWLVTVISCGFTAMLLGLLGGAFGHRLFCARGLTFIALISYSLYLVHLPLLYLAEIATRRFVDLDALSEGVAYVFYLPVFMALCVFVSTALYVFIEKPFINWSKKKFSPAPALKKEEGGKTEKGEKPDHIGHSGQKDG
ncbi:MAG: acyltransferase [Alphaproteobacteria bacterium]